MPAVLRIGSFRFHFCSNQGSEPVLLASNRGVSLRDWCEIVRLFFLLNTSVKAGILCR